MADRASKNDLHKKELLRLMILIEAYKCRASETPQDFLVSAVRMAMSSRKDKDQAIDAEINFLVDKNYLKWRWRELGATKLFQITAEGVLMLEREFPAHVKEL
jgi:DNA-binding PadR family transcriptional regulator